MDGATAKPQGTRRKASRAPHLCWPAAFIMAATLLISPAAEADIYSYIGKDGVVHFTNQPRPGRRWKRVLKTGPGKAGVVHARRRSKRKKRSKARYHQFDQHIRQAAVLYHIPEALVRAMIRVESDYTPTAVSRVGAKGLMQLMPATAKGMGVVDAFDARQNIFGGTRYLRLLANRFAGDLVLTIAGYHAGPGAIRKYKGVPPYRTTQSYVRMVLKQYQKYRGREAEGS
jgi:soluble lytic murein transglycosylase-like protein